MPPAINIDNNQSTIFTCCNNFPLSWFANPSFSVLKMAPVIGPDTATSRFLCTLMWIYFVHIWRKNYSLVLLLAKRPKWKFIAARALWALICNVIKFAMNFSLMLKLLFKKLWAFYSAECLCYAVGAVAHRTEVPLNKHCFHILLLSGNVIYGTCFQ